MRRPFLIAVIAVALAATGCGSSTTVTGKVTYQGKPVVYGSVVLIDASGTPKGGNIEPDGTFRISGVRPGPVKASVSSPSPPGYVSNQPAPRLTQRDVEEQPNTTKVPPAPPEVIKAWFPIPDTYGDPLKSGLTADVKPGEPLNLDLK